MLRCNLLIFIVLATLIAFASLASASDTYEGKSFYRLEDLQVEENCGFDTLHLKGLDCTFEQGAPILPQHEVNIALPTDARVLKVDVINVKTIEIEGVYNIMPNAAPIRLSDAPLPEPFQKTHEAYETGSSYPGYYVKTAGAWDLVGQDFITLHLFPIQYNPVTGKASLATEISFLVEYQRANNPIRETYNFSNKVKNQYFYTLKNTAFNPSGVAPIPAYGGSTIASLTPGNTEYVIITNATYASTFQTLADWRTQMGIPATIVDKTWIYANYSGADNQERIRNFIIDANATWGAIYFLLGGDAGIIPYHTKTINPDSIPNDTYYSDFDNDWKCEVYVGRACVNSTSQASTFVNKVLTYEKNPPSNYGNKVFFMGFDLDSSTPAEKLMKNLKSNFVPATSAYVSEYDSESGSHESDVKSYINQGQNIINHADHSDTKVVGVGSIYHGDYLNLTEAKSFTNGTKYSNFYSIGCWAGNYTSTCWGESFVMDNNGGISFIGNSRYGWYQQGNTSSFSFKYDQQYIIALFSSNFYILGQTHAKHKNAVFPAFSTMKYVFTELNLFGDPALHLWTDNPIALSVTHPSTINTGAQSFPVNVKSSGADLENALVCVMKGSEVYAYDVTDSTGNVSLSIDPATIGAMTVTVTAQNHNFYEGVVSVQIPVYPPTLSSITPNYATETGTPNVTVKGANFTNNPPTTVTINGQALINHSIVNGDTITGQAPTGLNGWYDVTVSNSYGNQTLVEGFRYFPSHGNPFNCTDIKTNSLNAPCLVNLIVSGVPGTQCMLFYSLGGGPINTSYGMMGLNFPFYFVVSLNISSLGYAVIPVNMSQGFGPIDLYIHGLGLSTTGKPVWAVGGANPISDSILIHLNN